MSLCLLPGQMLFRLSEFPLLSLRLLHHSVGQIMSFGLLEVLGRHPQVFDATRCRLQLLLRLEVGMGSTCQCDFDFPNLIVNPFSGFTRSIRLVELLLLANKILQPLFQQANFLIGDFVGRGLSILGTE